MKAPKAPPREIPEVGTYPFTLVDIIDMGTQTPKNTTFQDQRKVWLGFELLGTKNEKGDNFYVGREYGFTVGKKSNLGKDLVAWGKDPNADFDKFLGDSGMLSIVHNPDKSDASILYANIAGLMALPAKMKVAKHMKPLTSFYLESPFDEATFKDLPEWMRNKIAAAKEYAEIRAEWERKDKRKAGKK